MESPDIPGRFMLMKSPRNPAQTSQSDLFHPVRRLPQWQSLPPASQRNVIRLIAMMLRQQMANGEREVMDE